MPLRPAFPQGKGFIERMIEYLQTSWLPLRSLADLEDMQAQADSWTVEVADGRHVRRLGGTAGDALGVEREQLRPLPARWPDVDSRLEARASSDGFVRVADVDYSVPPRLAGRRLAVRLSLTDVIVFCDAPRPPGTAGPGPGLTFGCCPSTPASCAWPARPAERCRLGTSRSTSPAWRTTTR